MKKFLHFVFIIATLLLPKKDFATHVFGSELRYDHISGNTYQVQLIIYGDCSGAAYPTLSTAQAPIFLYDGNTFISCTQLQVTNAPGQLVTPVCPSQVNNTWCANVLGTIPGISKWILSGTVTVPYPSANWRFIWQGELVSSSGGRSGAITNIVSGSTAMMVDSLNNTQGPNSNAMFTSPLIPFYSVGTYYNYNPAAIDTNNDSLSFQLIDAKSGNSASCGAQSYAYSSVPYIAGYSGQQPLHCAAGTFSFENTSGEMGFKPDIVQRSLVVYHVQEYRNGVMVGACDKEFSMIAMTLVAQPDPPSGFISNNSAGVINDSVDITVGQQVGPFTFQINPLAQYGDSITMISSGLPNGSNLTITNNGNLAPQSTFSWNTAMATPGNYTFYITLLASTCPLQSMQVIAYHIHIIPQNPNIITDSFSVYVDSGCNGAQFNVIANNYSPALNVTTYFGDGLSENDAFTPAYTPTGIASFSHAYAAPGTYTIKHVLFDGGAAIDSATYSYTYVFCRTMPVKFYYDYNGNCVFDSLTEPYNYYNAQVEIDSNNIVLDTVSATSGLYYNATGNPGDTYTFHTLSLGTGIGGLMVTCPATATYTNTLSPTVNYYSTDYFGISCNGASGFDLAEEVTFHPARHHAHGGIIVGNSYCNAENGTVTINFSPKYTFGSSSPVPTTVTANSATWDFTGLSAFVAPDVIFFTLDTIAGNPPLIVGDTVNSTYQTLPITGDVNPANNFIARLDTVSASLDPNNMSVNPTDTIQPGTMLQYVIEFENTGNDTAYNIHVMDTLSDNVDMHSFKMMVNSAPVNVVFMNSNGHNIVKFDMPNINLLDSTHHNQCDGMLVFTINAKNGLTPGTTIFNHAGIFFDYNPVVLTNTVENIIGLPEKVNNLTANTISIYPNPASTTLTINTGNAQYTSYTITNSLGQEITEQSLTTKMAKADISSLAAGIYYITLKGDNSTVVKKFVKM